MVGSSGSDLVFPLVALQRLGAVLAVGGGPRAKGRGKETKKRGRDFKANYANRMRGVVDNGAPRRSGLLSAFRLLLWRVGHNGILIKLACSLLIFHPVVLLGADARVF